MDSYPYEMVIGLDLSDLKADLHTITVRTNQHHKQILDVAPEALQEWVDELRQSCPEGRVAICLEQPASNLLMFLENQEFITVYAVNPVTLKKYREAFVTSRAKDDQIDAEFLADLLRSHLDKLSPWQPEDPQTRLLGQLVLHRRGVVDERTALTNRLQGLLKQYFPQALVLTGGELWRPLATAFLGRWPTLQAVKRARPETLKKFYYLQGSRSEKLIAKRLELIARAVALCDQEVLLEVYASRVLLIVKQLQLLVRTIKDYDKKIAQIFNQHPDREIYRNLPGAGLVFAPRLLISMGSNRDRFDNSSSLQCFSGIAPVTKQSGKKRYVHRRYLCPVFVKQSFHEYAKESILHSRWAAAYYKQQRERGNGHNTAVRALAYKWQRIIWKCWQDRVPYQEEIYETALRLRKSPLNAALNGVVLGKSPLKSDGDNN